MFIYPYKTNSQSAVLLKEILPAKMIRLSGSNFVGDPSKNVVNWGNSNEFKELEKCNLLNKPSAIGLASNKKTFFKTVDGKVSIPEFTTEVGQALSWLSGKDIVVGRSVLQGSGGAGITIYRTPQELEECSSQDKIKLYTKYIPKKSEWRIHVMRGKPFDIQRKSVRRGTLPNTWMVRNHCNGFIFTRSNAKECPPDVVSEAIKAIEAVGLDFGAVDVVWNEYRKKSFVLEINTAPGLENTTLASYIVAITSEFGTSFDEEMLNKYTVQEEKPKKKGLHNSEFVINTWGSSPQGLPQAEPAHQIVDELDESLEFEEED